MNYFALIYYLVDDYLARRAAFRDEHLRLANKLRQREELILGGAFSDPADRALLIFKVSDKTIVEEFVRQDPYVINGLVKRWEIRPWSVVIGNEERK